MKRRAFLILLLGLVTGLVFAAQGKQDFDRHSVSYSVYNSTFLLPEIAKSYKIKRSKYESIINVSVVEHGNFGSVPAKIEGTVTNLMQQQKALKFKEIKEENATYYLAPIRIASEETVHIEILVTPAGESEPLHLKITTKLYAE